MSRKKKESLHDQINDVLAKKMAIGQSKHEDKRKNETADKIYSWDTYHAYKKHSLEFANWARNNEEITQKLGHKARSLEELRPFVSEWLQGEISRDMAASTVHLKASALAKLYSCSTTNFGVELPERRRADIKRSRGEAVRDAHFSEENHSDMVTFCKCAGLRRSELLQIRGEDLKIGKDGNFYLNVTRGTKGGRPRITKLLGTPEELERIKEIFQSKGKKKVFPKVSSAADIHSYRSIYACKVYKAAERNLKEYKNERVVVFKNRIVEVYTASEHGPDRSKKEYYDFSKKDRHGNIAMKEGYRDVSSVYVCRRDQAKVYYDRQAMFEASQALGHNRESVIAGHYLYNLDQI